MIELLLLKLINRCETFIGEAPIGIDDCQWIRVSSGATKQFFGKDNYDKPLYSIYVRGTNNEETAKRTKSIFKQLRNYSDAQSCFVATRLPSFVGKDDKHRSVYVFQLEYQTGGY